MPHYKCVTCTTRLTAPGACEGCGSALEPVDGLSEIVGYRLMRPRASAGGESFAVAVAMALQGMDTTGPRRHTDGRTR